MAALAGPNAQAKVMWHYNAECPYYPAGSTEGCAYRPDTSADIQVYVSPGLGPDLDDVAWHEEGHVKDFTVVTEAQRQAWRRINHREAGGWWDGEQSPGEQFAESFRMCALHTREYMAYNYEPTRTQLRRTCRLLRNIL